MPGCYLPAFLVDGSLWCGLLEGSCGEGTGWSDPSVLHTQRPEIPGQVISLLFSTLCGHDFRIVTPFLSLFFLLYGIHRLLVWGLLCLQPPPRGSATSLLYASASQDSLYMSQAEVVSWRPRPDWADSGRGRCRCSLRPASLCPACWAQKSTRMTR